MYLFRQPFSQGINWRLLLCHSGALQPATFALVHVETGARRAGGDAKDFSFVANFSGGASTASTLHSPSFGNVRFLIVDSPSRRYACKMQDAREDSKRGVGHRDRRSR